MTRTGRPVFLDLTKIEMPVGAWTSIGHRISGVVLALSAPFGVYLLTRSLHDEQGFAAVIALLRHGVLARGAIVIVIWALAHHVLGGIRHLLSDIDIGSPLHVARKSGWVVNLAGVAIALVSAWLLL